MGMRNGVMIYEGRPRKIETPEELRDYFMAYIQDVEENPLNKPMLIHTSDGVELHHLPLPRPLTLKAFRLFLDIDEGTWRYWWKTREDLWPTMRKIQDAIFNQKFEGAAVGLFNANLMSRELGLADRQHIEGTLAGTPTKPADKTELANCIHPDDPDPDGPDRPLFTPAQIAAGIPFYEPK